MSNKFKIIHLESDIVFELNRDNGRHNTFHFVWSQDEKKIRLDILSCNPRTKQVFLLMKKYGVSHTDCLEKSLLKIKNQNPDEYGWEVRWSDGENWHISYFRGKSKKEVKEKLNYMGPGIKLLEIRKMPLS
jgi:hypothetical protein